MPSGSPDTPAAPRDRRLFFWTILAGALVPTLHWMGRHPATSTPLGPVGRWPAIIAIALYALAVGVVILRALPRAVALVLLALLALMAVSGAASDGFAGFSVVVGYVLLTVIPTMALLIVGVRYAVGSPIRVFWLLPIVVLVAVQWSVGARFGTDFLLLLVALLVLRRSQRFARAVADIRATPNTVDGYWRATRLALLVLLACWTLAAVWDGFLRLIEPRRLPNLTSNVEHAPPSDRTRTGLTLSGGGYRAALFHAGVLNALRRLDMSPHVVASVSGGSIIGAYYALGGRPDDFIQYVVDGRFNLKRELGQLPNFVRLLASVNIPGTALPLAPFPVTRTKLQSQLLDRLLFGGARFSDHPGLPAAPELLLCTADLQSGNAIGFTRTGFVQVPVASWYERYDRKRLGDDQGPQFVTSTDSDLPGSRPISDLVAASGAFPGALEPLEIVDSKELPMTLVDGGLVDNYGLMLLQAMNSLARTPANGTGLAGWRIDEVIVSDGSALDAAFNGSSFLTQLQRAMDIVYRFTGPRDTDYPGPRVVILSPRLLFVPGLTTDVLSREDQPRHLEVYVGAAILRAQAPSAMRVRSRDGMTARLFVNRLGPPLLSRLVRWMTPTEKRCFRELLRQLDMPSDTPPEVCAAAGIPSPFVSLGARGYPIGSLPSGPIPPDLPTRWGPWALEENLLALLGRHTAVSIRAFASVSTLDDQIPAETAAAIADLGESLVYVKLREMRGRDAW